MAVARTRERAAKEDVEEDVANRIREEAAAGATGGTTGDRIFLVTLSLLATMMVEALLIALIIHFARMRLPPLSHHSFR